MAEEVSFGSGPLLSEKSLLASKDKKDSLESKQKDEQIKAEKQRLER